MFSYVCLFTMRTELDGYHRYMIGSLDRNFFTINLSVESEENMTDYHRSSMPICSTELFCTSSLPYNLVPKTCCHSHMNCSKMEDLADFFVPFHSYL